MNNLINKLFSSILMLVFLALFMLAYVFSLVIIKPRDVTKSFDIISNYLLPKEKIFTSSKKVTLLWNKKRFSFDLHFNDNIIKFNEQKILIPNLLINFRKRDLIRLKLRVSQINIDSLDYVVNFSDRNYFLNKKSLLYSFLKHKQVPLDLIEDEKYIKSDLLSKLFIFSNIRIEQLNIIDLVNNKEYQIIDFLLRQYRSDDYNVFSTSFLFKFQNNKIFNFNNKCYFDNNNHLDNCDVNFNKITSNIFSLWSNNVDMLKISGDISVNLQKFAQQKYQVSFNSKFDDLSYKNSYYKDLTIDGSILISPSNILVANFNVLQAKKQLSGVMKYNKDNKLLLTLSGSELLKKEIFLLWPEKAATITRSWLEKSLLNSKVKKFNLELQFDFFQKKKLEKISGQFNFYDTNFKFHSEYVLINKASGIVKLEQKKLDILIDDAFIDDQPISNIKVFIPNMVKNKSVLNIIGDIKIKSKSLIKFLLAEKFPEHKLRLLKKIFTDNHVKLNLLLAINLKSKITNNDIKLKINGKIDNLSKLIFSNDSYVNFKVDKSFAQSAYLVSIDYANAAIDLPIIEYNKKQYEKLDVSFKLLKDNSELLFANINIVSPDNVDIKGLLSLKSDNLFRLNFNDALLGKNNFSINFVRDKKTIVINSDNLFIKDIKFFDLMNIKAQKSQDKNFIIKGNIDKLHFSGNKKLNNIQLLYNCITKCNFLYVEGDITVDLKNNLTNKFFLQYNDKEIEELIFETDNLGYILSVLGKEGKLSKGDFHLNLMRKNKKLLGRLHIADFYISNKKLINKLADLEIINKNISAQEKPMFFYKGVANVSIFNKSLTIKDFVAYGKLFGVTSKGKIDLRKQYINLGGSIVPAYKINNLLGIKDIPILGRFITGGRDKGLVSASYKLNGNLDAVKLSFNPLTIILPSFFKSMGQLF